MAADGVSPAVAIRSSVGVELWSSSGPKLPYEHKPNLPREETKNSRSITFSPDGRYFAYSNGQEVKILETSNDWQLKCELPRPKAFYLQFSPKGNFLCTWELYVITKDIPDGSPNMFVYDVASGAEVFSVVQKTQTDWEPSWSSDESIFAMVVGGEALFYDLAEGIEGFKTTAHRIGISRGGMLSLGPGNSPPFLAFYTPGSKGSPSVCKMYKYPALSVNQTVAYKGFFQADRVEMLWNKIGSGLLLLTSTEVDKSGASYYGNQSLHFMSTHGDTCSVSLSKQGPVHCVKWSPKAKEFVVVYGYMPSKAALYNLKCDVIFNFGEGPRNCAYFNPFGTIVVLAGFGNLPGNVEIWDVQKKEKLADIKCPDTTHFDWNPNGEYFVTATTAPRLRIGNGFKVYHYSGALIHETIWPQGQELLGIEWQKFPENTFKIPIITKAKHEGIKSSQPEASKKAYTPPHLRCMQEGKNPEKYVPQIVPGLTAGTTNNRKGPKTNKSNRSKNTRRENFVNNGDVVDEVESSSTETQTHQNQVTPNRRQIHKRQTKQFPTRVDAADGIKDVASTQNQAILENKRTNMEGNINKIHDNDKDKKIRNVAKKLSDIKKLKARQDQGESLELNQLNKISLESKYLEELKALKLSA